MTIIPRPEHEKLIAQAIKTGAYQNPDEVIERALRMLNSEEEWLVDHKEFFLAEESQADMEKRKAARLRERHG